MRSILVRRGIVVRGVGRGGDFVGGIGVGVSIVNRDGLVGIIVGFIGVLLRGVRRRLWGIVIVLCIRGVRIRGAVEGDLSQTELHIQHARIVSFVSEFDK